ncbi:MAG: CPBP family glutamic-type intramembrane protease [Bacteroidota bacterium]
MIETLSAYWKFLKRPHLVTRKQDKSHLWRDIAWLLLLDFVVAIIVLSIYAVLLHSKLIAKHQTFDLFAHGFWWAFIMGAFLAPAIEELIFRWQLKKPKASLWFVLLSIGVIGVTATKNDYARFFIFVALIVISFLLVSYTEKLQRRKTIPLFRTYYIFLFYYTAIVFGYSHIGNVKGLTLADPAFIFFTGSQVFGGLTLGYIRVRYGLRYSILSHTMFNGFMIPLAWLSM